MHKTKLRTHGPQKLQLSKYKLAIKTEGEGGIFPFFQMAVLTNQIIRDKLVKDTP